MTNLYLHKTGRPRAGVSNWQGQGQLPWIYVSCVVPLTQGSSRDYSGHCCVLTAYVDFPTQDVREGIVLPLSQCLVNTSEY